MRRLVDSFSLIFSLVLVILSLSLVAGGDGASGADPASGTNTVSGANTASGADAAEANTASGVNTVVMLGDSLTKGGQWSGLDDESVVLNYGVSGDGFNDIVLRMDEVIEAEPDMVFLQVGVNDLARLKTPQDIVEGHLAIWKILSLRLDCKIVVCSLTPVSRSMSGRRGYFDNRRIREVNALLAEEAAEAGLDFVDLYAVFADQDQALPNHLTFDGIHLTPEAYDLWRAALAPYFQRHIY
ncbi:MAG: GDSL-type esterase/lipase family protein [Deltaproteobacteria bacterium]|jgi:lysophospholipase L1-like esterase|nr:GDSL-type esterase/lipase family protein [Deltaproteobacteria bacterium]